MSSDKNCIHCGRTERDHCDGFEAPAQRVMPPGCRCEPESWGMEPRPICKQYAARTEPLMRDKNCANCEHDEACHAVSERAE